MNALDVFYSEIEKRASAHPVLERAAKSVKDFAKRQAHGLTGAYGHEAANIGLNPEAVRAGITSLPGLARGVATKPRETLKAVGREALSGGATVGLGMGVGVPVAFAAPGLLRGDESSKGGLSVRQKAVNLGTDIAGGALTAGVPIIPGAVGGLALQSLAEHTIGRRG